MGHRQRAIGKSHGRYTKEIGAREEDTNINIRPNLPATNTLKIPVPHSLLPIAPLLSLSLSRYFFHYKGFYNIAFFYVIKLFNGQAAFKALRNFLGIVLEPL